MKCKDGRSVLRLLTSFMVFAIMMLSGKGSCVALADQAGSFTVTGGDNYSYSDNVLTIKSGSTLTVSGGDNKGSADRIQIDGTGNVSLILDGITIYHSEEDYGPAIELLGDADRTVTIEVKGKNNLTTKGASAIQKNGTTSKLVLKGDGTLTATSNGSINTGHASIGGASEKSSGNIAIQSGTYNVSAYSGGAAIGGGYKGKGINITITGGTVKATVQKKETASNLVSDYIGAAIGGGGDADGENITISGGEVTATVSGSGNLEGSDSKFTGAAIGGGCNGEGKNIIIEGGKVTAKSTSDTSGCGIGSGCKTNSDWNAGTTVNITGGYVETETGKYSAGIGGYGFSNGSETKIDNAVVTIGGGTVYAKGGTDSVGIGGAKYSDAHVYISGGNVYAIANNKEDSIGVTTSSCTFELKNKSMGVDVHCEKPVNNSINVKGNNYEVVAAAVEIHDGSGNDVTDTYNYGINDMTTLGFNAETYNNVFVYLPAGYTLYNVKEAGATTPTDTRVAVNVNDIMNNWNYNESTTYFKNAAYTVQLDSTAYPSDKVSVKYTGNTRTAIGSYTATATITAMAGYKLVDSNGNEKDNYQLTLQWKIQEYTTSPTLTYTSNSAAYTPYVNGGVTWCKGSSVNISASGYTICQGTNTGPFNSSLTLSTDGEKNLYFKKDGGGYITTSPQKVNLKFDSNAPTGTISLDNKTYRGIDTSTATKTCRLNNTAVTITSSDTGSGIKTTQYAFLGSPKKYTDSDIEDAVGTWQTYNSSITFPSGEAKALYVKLTDKAGNVSYLSTELIYNDTVDPVVSGVSLTNATTDSVSYSFTVNKPSTYYGILVPSGVTAPNDLAAIKDMYNNTATNGYKGFTGSGTGVSNQTITGLKANTSYTLHVAAEDDRTSLTGTSNSKASAVASSSSVTTKQKTVAVAAQTYQFRIENTAKDYTYDIKKMLTDSVSSVNDLGAITYTVSGSAGDILSRDLNSSDVNNGVLTIPVKHLTNSASDKTQNITITYSFGNTEYATATTTLTLKAVSKTPITPSGITVSNKTYDGSAYSYSGTLSWKDSNNTTVNIDANSVTYTYYPVTVNGNTRTRGTALTGAPFDAGDYDLVISANTNDYTGSQAYSFSILPKNLSDSMSGVKWYITHNDSTTLYNSSSTYYADGNDYKMEVKGYPDELNVSYTDCTANTKGEHQAVATYYLKNGLSSGNYKLPDSSNQTWKLQEKTEEFQKTTPDVSGLSFKYVDSNGKTYNDDSEFIEDGEISYSLIIDNFPNQIQSVSYKIEPVDGTSNEGISGNSVSKAGKYRTTATFVVDTNLYNTPKAKVSDVWTVHTKDGDPVPKVKKDVNMSGVKWVYTHDGSTRDYNSSTVLYADGRAYTVYVTGLPEQVVVKYSGVCSSASDGGTAVAAFTLKSGYENDYNVPASMTLAWRILPYEPQPEEPPVEVNDNPVELPSVGSIVQAGGYNVKILSASEDGGTVEYQGQTKKNKKATKISVPPTVEIDKITYKVTAIQNGAFNGYKKLKSVTIGKNVETIGKKAFYKCTALKSVTIPANVTTIGDQAFYGDKKLSKITIKSKKLKKVGKKAIGGINKKATIKCPNKKLAKQYKKKLFKSKTGYKKTMKIK